MKVTLNGEKLCTPVFSKPVDTHTYLHATSFHARSTIISLPKTQFIRIRRLCTCLSDYQHEAQKFVDFFVCRGYKQNLLQRYVREVADMSREDLFSPKATIKDTPNHSPARTVLSIAWHPRYQTIQRILHQCYSRFTT